MRIEFSSYVSKAFLCEAVQNITQCLDETIAPQNVEMYLFPWTESQAREFKA